MVLKYMLFLFLLVAAYGAYWNHLTFVQSYLHFVVSCADVTRTPWHVGCGDWPTDLLPEFQPPTACLKDLSTWLKKKISGPPLELWRGVCFPKAIESDLHTQTPGCEISGLWGERVDRRKRARGQRRIWRRNWKCRGTPVQMMDRTGGPGRDEEERGERVDLHFIPISLK